MMSTALGVFAVVVPTIYGHNDEEVTRRVAMLSEELRDNEAAFTTWYWLWTAGYGTASAGSLGLGLLAPRFADTPADERRWRVNMFFSAGTTAVALGLMALTYPTVIGAADAIETARDGTPDGERHALMLAERLAATSADEAAMGVAWYQHAANAAFNLAVSLVMWLGFGYGGDALVNFLISTAVVELQILTQPTGLIDDWRGYQNAAMAGRTTPGQGWIWQLVPMWRGVGLRVVM